MIEKAVIEEDTEGVHNRSKGVVRTTLFEVEKLRELGMSNFGVWERLG